MGQRERDQIAELAALSRSARDGLEVEAPAAPDCGADGDGEPPPAARLPAVPAGKRDEERLEI